MKGQIRFRVDSAVIRDVPRLPFASEMGLQDFVERNVSDLLGLEVIASDRRSGGRLFRIDILAVDDTDRPFIIECKHDLVDASAFEQLVGYKADLLSGWGRFEERLAEFRRDANRQKSDPVLITIGYRYDKARDLNGAGIICLAYRYHDVAFSDGELQQQKPGRVSLHRVDSVTPPGHHPRVCKKFATVERLARLAPKLQAAFWEVDGRSSRLEGVSVRYGGKNFVRYRVPRGQFAEAKIGAESLEWSFGPPGRWRERRAKMLAPSDAEEVLHHIRQAYRVNGRGHR